MGPTPSGRDEGILATTPLVPAAAEWRWVFTIVVVTILLTQIPPTAERWFGPADRVHVGTYWYAGDFAQYLAAIREGATTTSWFIHNHLTSEPHTPVFMYTLYVAIGKIAGATGIPAMAVHAAFEQIMRVFLVASLYLFLAALLPTVAERRFGFALAAFSGGLGVWKGLGEALFASDATGGTLSAINTFVETVTFGSFLAAPHVGLGLSATLLSFVCFDRAARGSRAAIFLLAAAVATLAVVHPFNLPVLIAAFGAFTVVETLRTRHLQTTALLACLTAAVLAAPIVAYNAITFGLDPFWSQTYGGPQNTMPSPRPWDLPTDYGLVLPLALVGIAAVWRRTTSAQRLALVWLTIGAVCMYTPVPYQRRFGFGLQPVLAALAVLGWPLVRVGAVRLTERIGMRDARRDGVSRRLMTYPLLILGFTTPIAAYLAIVASAATNQPVPIYMVDRETYAIGQWIRDHSDDDDVTLGSFNTGNGIVGLLPGRVVLGYDVATVRAKEKNAEVRAIYGGTSTDADTRRFLTENRVSYLIVGPEERKLGDRDPGLSLGLQIAAQVGQATVYRTNPRDETANERR
ncbi:MAG: hypothetical protein HW416_1280 [Chloroflexi bacterium]|nr:hypothetical protein [Chloroflexota bacterium]